MQTQSPADSIPQLEEMRLGVAYRFEARVRGFAVMLRPLSMSETIEVAAEVAGDLESFPAHARNRVTEHSLFCKKTLVKASTSAPDARDPRLTEYILDRMTSDEVLFLFKQYTLGTDRVNPALETMPEETLRAMIEDLKKNPSALIERSTLELVNVARFLLTSGD